MAVTEQVLYEAKAERLTWMRSVIFFFISASVALAGGVMFSKRDIPFWPFLVPVLFFIGLLLLYSFISKATFTITKSVKGELHCELKTNSKVIAQGPPQSMFYWMQVKSTMTNDTGGLATLLELKTKHGDIIGLMSKSTGDSFEKMEQRAMGFDGDFPKYSVADVPEIIHILHAEGIPFSFK